MNILFLTIGHMESFRVHALYPDLLRELIRHGHTVYAVSALEKRQGDRTIFTEENGSYILRVHTGNLTKCGMVEKGISVLRLESVFLAAIKKYCAGIKFDFILYSTPPITLEGVVNAIKKRDGAATYLLLKDIFPQNAVDIGLMKKTGPSSLLYHFFRRKEKRLYRLSDHIGCMSQANVEYLLREHRDIRADQVEVCPNCIEIRDVSLDEIGKAKMRQRYGLPLHKKIFVYGGNLGKPQNIPFMIECMRRCQSDDVLFLVAGGGTDYHLIERYIRENEPENIRLLPNMPKDDYDMLTAACDVGLIFLDYSFTIPNFPSRLLTYMQAKLPVAAFTDLSTDVGKVIAEGGFGWWAASNDAARAASLLDRIGAADDLHEKGEKAFNYLKEHYTVDIAYRTLERRIHDVSHRV